MSNNNWRSPHSNVPNFDTSPIDYTPNGNYYRAPLPRIAVARLIGGPFAPEIKGTVTFQEVPGGTLVCVTVSGLPPYSQGTSKKPQVGPFGFHIHEKGNCAVGDPKDPFKGAGGHYNPTNQPHGNHAGDFPVLFSNNGIARMCFFTSKFKVQDVMGRSVVIHESPDDYRTEPAGNSGRRLACGVIEASPR